MTINRQGIGISMAAAMMIASYYGGLCLGPVNTAAVHALAYPLGGEFHIAHGVANALLLPHVLRLNIEASPERYARIAEALGVGPSGDPMADALAGVWDAAARERSPTRSRSRPRRLACSMGTSPHPKEHAP